MTEKSWDEKQRILHSPFSIEVHKDTFYNYLEVVIHPDGTVHYAVPSHQEYIYGYLMTKLDKTREEINNMVPLGYYFDMHRWLCKMSGCIMVWNEVYLGDTNRFQKHALERLKREGLYKGDI